MESLILVGTGAFSDVAAAYFSRYSNYRIDGFAVTDPTPDVSTHQSLPLMPLADLPSYCSATNSLAFVAIGYRNMNRHRMRIVTALEEAGVRLASFVHPSVDIWPTTVLGSNTFIFEDNTLQPFTTIGNGAVLWSGNHIGHHSSIGDYCFISSHVVVSGNCRVGKGSFIGVNASLHDGIRIGDFALIGAGAVIARDIPDRAIVSPPATRPREQTTDDIDF